MKKLIILVLAAGTYASHSSLKATFYVVNNSSNDVAPHITDKGEHTGTSRLLPAGKATSYDYPQALSFNSPGAAKDLYITDQSSGSIKFLAGPISMEDNTTYTYSADGKLTSQKTITAPTNLYIAPPPPGTPAWFAQQKSQANK